MKKPSLWSLLFRRQPIEEGVHDQLEADHDAAVRRVREAATALNGAIEDMLATIDRDQRRTHRERSP